MRIRTVIAALLGGATIGALLCVIWLPAGARWQWAATALVLLLATAVVGGSGKRAAA